MFEEEEHKAKIKNKSKNWGQKKVNPIRQLGNATSWNLLKQEIPQENTQDEKISHDELQFKKQREQNYRKSLIEEGVKHSKTWENFSEVAKQANGLNGNPFHQKVNKSYEEKNIVKTKTRRCPTNASRLIREADLKDFDSRNLTVEQNLHMRKLLAKAATRKGVTIERAIKRFKNNKFKSALYHKQ